MGIVNPETVKYEKLDLNKFKNVLKIKTEKTQLDEAKSSEFVEIDGPSLKANWLIVNGICKKVVYNDDDANIEDFEDDYGKVFSFKCIKIDCLS